MQLLSAVMHRTGIASIRKVQYATDSSLDRGAAFTGHRSTGRLAGAMDGLRGVAEDFLDADPGREAASEDFLDGDGLAKRRGGCTIEAIFK